MIAPASTPGDYHPRRQTLTANFASIQGAVRVMVPSGLRACG
jgi:hypothetical protein